MCQGGDSSGAGSTSGVGSIAALVATPPALLGVKVTPPQAPAALLALARNNPTGRELNLGLGKNQFSVGATSKTAARDLNICLGRPQTGAALCASHKVTGDQNDAGIPAGMTDLWATTTFNNDSDGRMAEKFKRLMGVKGQTQTAPPEGILGAVHICLEMRQIFD